MLGHGPVLPMQVDVRIGIERQSLAQVEKALPHLGEDQSTLLFSSHSKRMVFRD